MARNGKRRLFLAVALAAVLAGGTAAALGATGSGHSAKRHHGQHRRLHARRSTAKLPGAAAARHGHLHLRAIVRSYLGLTRMQLRTELRSGKTLAQIADATPGHSAAGLREAILSALRSRLDGKVAAHALSTSAEQHRLSHLQPRIEALLERSHPGRRTHAHQKSA